MFSILKMEDFAEKHQHWLHAVWVSVWAFILTYLAFSFIFFSLTEEDSMRQSLAEYGMHWIVGLFLFHVVFVALIMPMIHWFVPQVGRLIMGYGIFNLESVYYFIFSFQFLPLALVSMLGLPFALLFLIGQPGSLQSWAWVMVGQRLLFYIFPALLLVCIGLVFWKGSWLLHHSSTVEYKEALLFFTGMILIHVLFSFVDIAIVLLLSRIIPLL